MYADDGLLLLDEDSADIRSCCNEMCILSVNVKNIYLDDNFDKDDLDTTIFTRLLAWYGKLKKNAKHLKKLRINANNVHHKRL